MEIINIGTDIEEVARIKKLPEKTLRRVFTRAELDYCLAKKNSAQHLAARFAAKEAVFKALPFDAVALKKIEVIKDKNNKPQIVLRDGRAKDIVFKVSLSHTAKYAAAFIIALKK
jgi:holo-[acyl-carrier protein] synthase